MTPKEFQQLGYSAHLKVFLDSPTGKALIAVVEDYGKPNNGARQKYGTSQDIQLQMSLNYVAMEQAFAISNLIQGLVQPLPTQAAPKPVADLLPEDATAADLAARGIVVPPPRVFTKPEAPKPVEPQPAPSHGRRRRTTR